MLDTVVRLLDFLWASFLLLSPMLLLGLFLAGIIHVLISRSTVLRWLSGDNIRSVCVSAAVGVPIPLCSCSVVPVVAEMRNKGASRSSCLSFLITAPETGADSILVTHAFFGFAAAVVRPLVSFITAVASGIACIGLVKDGSDRNGASDLHEHRHDPEGCSHADADCAHGHSRHTPLVPGSEDCYVSPAQLKAMALACLPRFSRKADPTLSAVEPAFGESSRSGGSRGESVSVAHEETPGLGKVVKHISRYGFVEVADDILFALVVGIFLGGLLYLAVPDGMLSSDYARWISYPVMVLVGIPLYICASASTPIAAALVAKGLSPGAALIFLMTGPATNSGTIAIIVSQFGSRFASVYVAGVIAVTTVIGIAIDAVLIGLGLTLPVNLSASDSPAIQTIEWTAAFALMALIIWRFRHGALKSGYRDLVSNLSSIFRHSP